MILPERGTWRWSALLVALIVGSVAASTALVCNVILGNRGRAVLDVLFLAGAALVAVEWREQSR